jgi:hypothetical protein
MRSLPKRVSKILPGHALETWETASSPQIQRTPLFPYVAGDIATATSESAQP